MTSNPTPEERRAQILARYNEGATMQQIGDELGISRERISQLIRLAGGKGRPWWERRKYNREEMLEHLRELAKGRRKCISPQIIYNAGKCTPKYYVAVFGSLSAAIDAAGIDRSVTKVMLPKLTKYLP